MRPITQSRISEPINFAKHNSDQKKRSLIWTSLVSSAFVSGLILASMALHYSGGQSRFSGVDWVGPVERILYDMRVRTQAVVKPSGQVGVLDIDDATLQKLGTWPLTRSSYALALKNLKNNGARWLALDIMFAESEEANSNDFQKQLIEVAKLCQSLSCEQHKLQQWLKQVQQESPADESLIGAFKDFGNVIHGMAFPKNGGYQKNLARGFSNQKKTKTPDLQEILQIVDEQSSVAIVSYPSGKSLADYPELLENNFLLNRNSLLATAKAVGFINNSPDPDGITRHLQTLRSVSLAKGEEPLLIPNLALQLAAQYLNRKIVVQFDVAGVKSIELRDSQGQKNPISIPQEIQGNGEILLKHYGGARSFPYISFSDAYQNKIKTKVPPILILGVSATGGNDIRPSPFSENFPGVEYHAAFIENILTQKFAQRTLVTALLEPLLILVLTVVYAFAFGRLSPVWSSFCLIVSLFLIWAVDRNFVFAKGIWAYQGVFYCQNLLSFTLVSTLRFLREEKEKRKLNLAFEQYLSPEVISRVTSDPAHLRLGGELRHISILFSDIRKFTTFSENLSPQALTQLLNDYLTPMTNIIMQSNGTVDKYIGDAIMAFWGAPLDLPEHPQVAVESAKRMIQTLRKLSPSWIKKGYPPIDIGIGVHSDEVVVGNVGSLQRFAYSAVGDGVNLTSRLEGLTKYYRVNILVSEQTIVRCKETIDSTFREVDLVLVVGRKEPVRIFEIMVHDPAEKHLFLDHVRDFAQALAFYRYGNFADARQDFLALAARPLQDYRDELSEMFAARCQDFLDASLKDRWDGIWLMKDK